MEIVEILLHQEHVLTLKTETSAAVVSESMCHESIGVQHDHLSVVLQDIVTWKGELYFVDEPTADPAKLEGSLVAFTKNGQTQGIAYR